MKIDGKNKNKINEEILNDVSGVVQNLDYGTVLITVHNNKITQLEVLKKQRFDSLWKLEE